MRVCALLKDYCENSTIHGLRYITQDGRLSIEKAFWLITVCMSSYGMYVLSRESWVAYQTHPVSFVTDTNYLRWNTTFPAVSVCETDEKKQLFATMKKFKLDKRLMYLYAKSVMFYPEDCSSCAGCGVTLPSCPENYQEFVNETRRPCQVVFEKCTWNGAPFPCCDNFFPLVTEMGPCLAVNSKFNRPQDRTKLLRMVSNLQTGPGRLELHLRVPARVYLHAAEEVPNTNHNLLNILVAKDLGVIEELYFKMKEIKNDPLLRSLSVESRGCRFGAETLPHSPHKYYSYSTCIVECRMAAMVELCNCTHIFMPNKENVHKCGAKGLACLYEHRDLLSRVRNPWEDITGLVCNCTIACSEVEIERVWKTSELKEDETSSIEFRIIMDSLPSEQYRRNVIRTTMDLVVSLGGTAGLFLGASLLSGVEIMIYIFVRSLSNKQAPTNQRLGPDNNVCGRRQVVKRVNQNRSVPYNDLYL